MEVGGDVLELLQGLGRCGQVVAVLRLERGHVLGVGEHVAAVIEDLAVGVAQHAVADAAPGVDVLERRRHHVVGPLRIVAALAPFVHRQDVLAVDQVAIHEGADDRAVILARAVAQVEEQLGVELADRDQGDVQLGAGQLLEDRPEGVDRPGDAALGAGIQREDGDLLALERLLVRAEQRPHVLLPGGDDGVVIVLAQLEQDRAVVLPFDELAGLGGREREHAERSAGQQRLEAGHQPDLPVGPAAVAAVESSYHHLCGILRRTQPVSGIAGGPSNASAVVDDGWTRHTPGNTSRALTARSSQ